MVLNRRSSNAGKAIFFAALLAGPGQAVATAPLDYFDLPPEQLLDMEVVSVSKRTEKLSDAPAAIFVITRDDIIRSGVTNIPDALRMAPGVQVAQADANTWAITIRGFNNPLANKLLVLIDGRTVYNPIFGGTYWEAQDVLLHDIDRIEVVRGPGGTLWGANAVNGVINIITQSAKETQGAFASGLYGTHEKSASARQGGAFGQDGFYRVYAKYFDREPYDKPDGNEGIDRWNSYRGGFRADWQDQFTLQGDIYHTESRQIDTGFSLIAPFSVLQEEDVEYTGANLLGRWTKNYDDGSLLSVQSYLDYSERDEPLLLKDERIIFDTEIQYNLQQIGRHAVIVGGGYRFTADDEGGTRNVSFSPASNNDSIYNAFIQDKVTLVPERWYLTLGTKLEHNDFSGLEIQPNARLQWLIDEGQTAWASVSRAVRTPTRLERDIDFTLLTAAGLRGALIGNEDFDSEELVSYEAGYRNQLTPQFSWGAAFFLNDYDQLAGFTDLPAMIVNNGVDPAHTLLPFHFTNSLTGEVFGGELTASWNVNDDWLLSANYSYIDMDLHSKELGSFNNEAAEGDIPHNMFNIRSSWNITEQWMLDTTVHYVDELEQNDVDDYIRLDMNLGWHMNDNFQFNLVGQNLLDDSHREFGSETGLNTTEPARAFFGKLTWQF